LAEGFLAREPGFLLLGSNTMGPTPEECAGNWLTATPLISVIGFWEREVTNFKLSKTIDNTQDMTRYEDDEERRRRTTRDMMCARKKRGDHLKYERMTKMRVISEVSGVAMRNREIR
jgi:hypothetical protein